MTLTNGTAADADAETNRFHDPAFLTSLREQMFKFALLQVRDEQIAEDAVQEAMLSAYLHIDRFARQSALKTWVFSILKNKLIDILRKEKRTTAASQLEQGNGLQGDELLESLFTENGHWQKSERPVKWDQPEHGTENAQFWKIFELCLEALPAKYGRFFMMREFLELDTDAICHTEDISVSNLNVTLYRARVRLRECLENNWFDGEKAV
ncbi:RNA polymerase factor sigma-70 [Maribrevibacterium harenarium]|uniref:RNA polymerase factor sigma-70 n=1 Tax=Maribrevibacterium harenarium TaxID=2589817 RepID=A0A501WDE9_9GAMM|nr:RNA polymerase factor sigma-70 [Maribrevibacterium harenarium]TPE47913.1 RNA polymerase factor sigma-70 [Maribrevibacterium harenarium]